MCKPSFGPKDRLLVMVLPGMLLLGCSRPSPRQVPAESDAPITLMSSTDFGCIAADFGTTSRLVRIRNTSDLPVRVSRWVISCDCLTVNPSQIEVPPVSSKFICLVFDPAKEGGEFTGDLRVSIEGFADQVRVLQFDVPISVVSPKDIEHLDTQTNVEQLSGQELGTQPFGRNDFGAIRP